MLKNHLFLNGIKKEKKMKKDIILEKALEYGIGIDLSGYKMEDVRKEFAKHLEKFFVVIQK